MGDIIHVPVTAAVRKYLLKRFEGLQESEGEIIKLTQRHYLGQLVLAHVEPDEQPEEAQKSPKDCVVTFRVPNKRPYWLPPERIDALSTLLEKTFKDAFCLWLLGCSAQGSIQKGIESFYEHFALSEEDYPQEHMRRYFTAHKTGQWQL